MHETVIEREEKNTGGKMKEKTQDEVNEESPSSSSCFHSSFSIKSFKTHEPRCNIRVRELRKDSSWKADQGESMK